MWLGESIRRHRQLAEETFQPAGAVLKPFPLGGAGLEDDERRPKRPPQLPEEAEVVKIKPEA